MMQDVSGLYKIAISVCSLGQEFDEIWIHLMCFPQVHVATSMHSCVSVCGSGSSYMKATE